MVSPSLWVIAFFTCAVCLLWLLSLRYDPTKRTGRITKQLLTGFLLLTAWNLCFSPQVGVNPLSAWLTGSLGLPGVGLTVLLNFL